MKKWTRARFHPNQPLEAGHPVTASREHIDLSRRVAAEGMVLLKNEGNVLPLAPGSVIAAVGRGVCDMVKGGGGTGDVYTPFVTTLAQGLRACGVRAQESLLQYYQADVERQYAQGVAPGMTVEPPAPEALLDAAAAETDTALIAFSRFSGEGWDRVDSGFQSPEFNPFKDRELLAKRVAEVYPDGDFYRTREETALVEAVCRRFKKVIVALNTGGIVDLSWVRDDARIQGALLMWQAGTDGGTAAAQLLTGAICPSGKLPDTFARDLADYPSSDTFHESAWYVHYTEDIFVGYRYFETFPEAADRVVYPFGYGLSYTSFAQELLEAREGEEAFEFTVQATNTGGCAGKDVVALYYQAPQGLLGRPARELGAFAKTRLLQPGESETLHLTLTKRQMSAFDDLGKVAACANVLEAGVYRFYLGSCVREAREVDFVYAPEAPQIVEQCSERLRPASLPRRLRADGSFEALPAGPAPDTDANILTPLEGGTQEGVMPAQRPRARYLRHDEFPAGTIPLIDVAEGRAGMEAFIAQLSDDDLLALLGGVPNAGVANTNGVGGLPEYGVPAVMTADGNAGVRIDEECRIATTAWPCQTLLASTWDVNLLYEVGRAAARELKENNLQIWLAPGLNIHRNPICGRNFEYYSEDPYLSGKLGAAQVRGIQSQGVAACVKHFACNDKETNRKHSDSRVSLRALRDIHLRGFEIAIREAQPWTLMCGYNIVNGQRCSESRDLLTGILREEWGYTGLVLSDWWDRSEHYKQILAGDDVKMPTGYPERVKEAMALGALGREDLEKCAVRVLEMICRLD